MAACAGLLVRAGLDYLVDQPLAIPSDGAQLIVKPGDSLGSVLAQLQRAGWLEYPRPIALWAKWQSMDRGLHVGEYAISPGMSAASLLAMLNRGEVVRYALTLPEGITLAQALTRIQTADGVEATLNGPQDPRLLQLVAPSESAEGWFLPETYQYTRGDTDYEILVRAHELMRQALDQAWADRAPNLPLTSPYEALILASIVERETSVASERPEIAGVFSRRLQRGMRLQTDPTVIYGLGSAYDGNLTRQHLRDDANPWNTYRIQGLPPTPIALPGVAALEAAVHPLPGESLYFVARGDGYHAFASTLEEHNANVKRYQLVRSRDYRSTPEPR